VDTRAGDIPEAGIRAEGLTSTKETGGGIARAPRSPVIFREA
jgi:hypothetical protein